MAVRAFYVDNTLFMLVLLALTAYASRQRAPLATGWLFLWVSGQEFWNAVFHVYAENQFSAYSPGFFTAVFLYLPTYGYLTYIALRERFLSPRAWAGGLAVGFVLLLAVIWAGLYQLGPVPMARGL